MQTERFLAEKVKDDIINNLPEAAEDIVKEINKEKPITISLSGKERMGMSAMSISINKIYNKITRRIKS